MTKDKQKAAVRQITDREMFENKANLRRILVCIFLMIVIFAESMVLFHYFNRVVTSECWEKMDGAAQEAEAEVVWMVRGSEGYLLNLAEVIGYLSDRKSETVTYMLQSIYLGITQSRVRMYLKDGYAVTEHGVYRDVSDKVRFEDIVSDKPYISSMKKDIFADEGSEDEDKWIVEHFCPLCDRNGEVVGMLAAVIELEKLPEFISVNTLSGEASILMLDRETGTIFMDTGHRVISNLSYFNRNNQNHDKWNSAIMEGRTEHSSYKSAKTGKVRYLYTRPCSVANWAIVVAADEEVVFSRLIVIKQIFYFAMLGQSLALAIYLFWVLRDTRKQLSIQKDLTEQAARAEIEEQQKKLLKENLDVAQEANRAKTTFLNNMSHDIRTPMNAIIGFTNLATEHIGDEKSVKRYLSKIGQSSEYLLALINDVLDMSRIESGKMQLDEKPENLSEIIESVGDVISAEVAANHITFTNEKEGWENEIVVCDKLRLKKALVNILSNAVKYTKADGNVRFCTRMLCKNGKGSAEFEFVISDNGIGMPKEFIKNIYEPFTRVNSTTVSGIQGTGLGMAITKKIVDMMQGSIDVSSQQGVGTTVTVKLCFCLKECCGKKDVAKESVKYDFTGMRVLLTEDNEMNREIAEEILTREGFVVECVSDGGEAVEQMKAAKAGYYSLILMDIQMPKMNGYEATRQIRALPDKKGKSIPIVAMTANAFEEDKKNSLEAGMDAHVSKPIDVKLLLSTLGEVLKRYENLANNGDNEQ